MRQADAAIVGRLTEVRSVDSYESEFLYEVRRRYKGGRGVAPGSVVSVLSAADGSACGLPTARERRYGLFLTRRQGAWRGSLCATVAPRSLAAAARQRSSGRSVVDDCAS